MLKEVHNIKPNFKGQSHLHAVLKFFLLFFFVVNNAFLLLLLRHLFSHLTTCHLLMKDEFLAIQLLGNFRLLNLC